MNAKGKMIYFDNAATTRPSEVAIEEMAAGMKKYWANPSSAHKPGREAGKEYKKCISKIADIFKCEKEGVIVTSGATESVNTVLKSFYSSSPGEKTHIVTCVTEHPSTIQTCRFLEKNNVKVTYLPVDKEGKISMYHLEKALQTKASLMTFSLVNNETGTILNLKDIVSLRNREYPDVKIHLDCVQALGKINCSLIHTGVDYMSFSSHKIYGPKGLGFIIKKPDAKIIPLLHGGGQQDALRSGTYNLPSLVSFTASISKTLALLQENHTKAFELKNFLLEELKRKGIDFICNSPSDASPYIVNLSFRDVKAGVLVNALEAFGIYISASSACSSNKKRISEVLKSMGVDKEYIEGSVRISFSHSNTIGEVTFLCDKIEKSLNKLNFKRI